MFFNRVNGKCQLTEKVAFDGMTQNRLADVFFLRSQPNKLFLTLMIGPNLKGF